MHLEDTQWSPLMGEHFLAMSWGFGKCFENIARHNEGCGVSCVLLGDWETIVVCYRDLLDILLVPRQGTDGSAGVPDHGSERIAGGHW